MALRKMGKAAFMNIKDVTGNIQCWLGINVLGEEMYNVFKLSDIGDIVGVEGRLMLSGTGELTIRVEKYTHLTKALRPLPEKFHGLTDVEERYRHRYVDLIMNDESRRVEGLLDRHEVYPKSSQQSGSTCLFGFSTKREGGKTFSGYYSGLQQSQILCTIVKA